MHDITKRSTTFLSDTKRNSGGPRNSITPNLTESEDGFAADRDLPKHYKSSRNPTQENLVDNESDQPAIQLQDAHREGPQLDSKTSTNSTGARSSGVVLHGGKKKQLLENWIPVSERPDRTSLVHQDPSKYPALPQPMDKPLTENGRAQITFGKRSFLPAQVEVASFRQGALVVQHRPATRENGGTAPKSRPTLRRRQKPITIYHSICGAHRGTEEENREIDQWITSTLR